MCFLNFYCNVFFLRSPAISKYFPEHKLPDNVIATTDAKAALLDADFCLHAVPVQVL
jgi:glycerol-3-phosphate dehydrogenase